MVKRLPTIAIIYFTLGIFFAIIYALFYHWTFFSFFSPGFFVVVFTWPLQIPGFLADYQIYGLAGKTLL